MHYTQTLANPDVLTATEAANFSQMQAKLPQVQTRFQAHHDDASIRLLRAVEEVDDLAEIQTIADSIRANSDGLLVLGTGGSSLGGKTLCALSDDPFPIDFLENPDPHTMQQWLARNDVSRWHILAVSKSGGTVETISQFLVLLAALEQKVDKEQIAKQCHVISMDTENNPIRNIAARYDIPTIVHDDGIGGRYSVLSNVGLIPAAVAGLDIKTLRKGASDCLQDALSNANAAPLQGAAWSVALMQSRPMQVLMPYADRLMHFTSWYKQLWAESIGKEGKGSTPVRAIGSIDQHSQLQLYLDGPKDKIFTVMTLPQTDDTIIQTHGVDGLDYVQGRSLGDVLAALQYGTIGTMKNNKLPLRLLEMQEIDEQTIGELLMHFMLETMMTADLMGVNAFDQPAVEDGKILARQKLAEQSAKAKAS